MSKKKPKVFVSHASEDKNRFVLEFANKLRENGIDAWLDYWEILPGDSLVDKIFEEGLGEANAVIVVLSEISVQKPWVREELNHAFIQKVSRKTKLIPVIIDDCSVPKSLKHIAWELIKDTNNYEKEFQRIVQTIFGVTDKPEIGKPPDYVQSQLPRIPALSQLDTYLFKYIYDDLILTDKYSVDTHILSASLDESIDRQTLFDTLSILERVGLIKIGFIGAGEYSIQKTISGFEQYGQLFLENFEEDLRSILYTVHNDKCENSQDIQSHFLHRPYHLLRLMLRVLKQRELLAGSEVADGMVSIALTAQGRRAIHSE